jgi:hypothetical protein
MDLPGCKMVNRCVLGGGQAEGGKGARAGAAEGRTASQPHEPDCPAEGEKGLTAQHVKEEPWLVALACC